MINILNELDLDIKRCENVLIENDYLEIVIAIEELHDKYKNTIDSISNINSNVVWNYSKKDIENIQRSLREYKEELILKENQKNIEEKIKDLKSYIELNDLLEPLVDEYGDLEVVVSYDGGLVVTSIKNKLPIVDLQPMRKYSRVIFEGY